jgi:hypothetical protein
MQNLLCSAYRSERTDASTELLTMATPVRTRPTNRFLGNNNSREVHDQRNEKASCQLDTIIRNGHGVIFSPDSLTQARSERYDNCAWCIGGSTR